MPNALTVATARAVRGPVRAAFTSLRRPFNLPPTALTCATTLSRPAAPAPPPEEKDKLWKCVLKLAGGDRGEAKRLLQNPDELLKHEAVWAHMDLVTLDKLEADAAPVVAAAAPAAEPEPEPVVEELQEEDPREHLNVVFIGHVDAGKSTLSGNILYLTGYVDKRTIEKYEREAKQRNRESWFLAFIMDTNEEERAKGKTVEVGRAPFETEHKRYTILDAPGHKNYVPHMISGAAQADVGILVISARRGEFETGFERGGQTREHAMLCKTLGVRFLVVVINKMDDPTVNWQRSRFDECVSKLKPFLKTCGYVIRKEVKFIPISGLKGSNVLTEVDPKECDWWTDVRNEGSPMSSDPTLLQLLDNLKIEGRSAEAALRIPVLDRYYERGCVAMGKVEAGRIAKGDKVIIMPTRTETRIEQIYMNDTVPVASAKPGENVNIKLGANVNVEDVCKGFVICKAPACPAVHSFTAQLALIELLEHRPIFTSGYSCMLHAHTVESECTCDAILEQINVKSKPGAPKRPVHFAKQGAVILCKISVPMTICVEAFEDMQQLGRFTLRDEGKSIAIGKIVTVDK
mmetsp:Transcript_10998/g.33962  ORF Transcript_10998/g.33962 Transcript_10998/m.33962 type:complete len:575 (+) Transcript_10998:479-2203(+)